MNRHSDSKQHRVLPGWPRYDDDEISAVAKVLASGRVNYWTGDEGRKFEREFADYVGVDHGVALANGSVALELALRALDIKTGDEVIVTPRSFIASASSIVVCGATPVFADIDRNSQNITAETIAPRISSRTRAIMLVHLAGWPCDMAPILKLAKQHDLRIIEDCAQAHGATYDRCPVGSFGDIGVFSFCQDKIITTGGEGGMLVTRSKALWEKAWSYKDHGKSHAAVYDPGPSQTGAFRWVHESFGSNFRMTEMQAAIGRIQLRKLDGWIEQRTTNARVLIERLSDIPALRVPVPDGRIRHAYYKLYTFLNPELLRPGWDRDRVISAVNELGTPCFGGSCSEVYREGAFMNSPFRQDTRLPLARELGDTSLMFPVHPTLTTADMNHMAGIIGQVMRQAQA